MLSIRNARVRELAEIVMRETGAVSITAAICQALEHEVERVRDGVPLRERLATLRERVRDLSIKTPGIVTRADIDELWEP